MLRYALTTAVLLVSFIAQAKTPGEIYEQAAKSTVIVRNIGSDGKPKSMGSGVVLPDRDVVTNCHVVKGASQLIVRIGRQEHPATLRYSDWERDVCSLSVPGIDASAVVVGSTKTLKVGAKVYAIGAPKGLELTLSDGIVSSLREVESGQYIQTTAAISRGSSGGGLFDENGALVGLTTFYLAEGQNLNFAVPVEWVKELPKRSAKNATDAQTVTQWLNKTADLESHKDWPALLEHSLRWTKDQPGSDMAWWFLGIAYGKAGQYAKAIDAYQQALRINSEHATAWYNLGIAYGKTGQFSKAIEAYQQALRINPGLSAAWHNLGNAYGNVGQSSNAIEAYQQALRINSEDADTWHNLGVEYDNSGQFARAIEAYQQALRIDPDIAEAWYKRIGDAYVKSEQPTKAIEAYRQALRINPESAEVWLNLGIAYGKDGQFAKAIEAYQQALRINPEDAKAWRGLGLAYGSTGQSQKAIEAYQQALRINPEYAEVWYNLGLAYGMVGPKAIEAYQQALRINPEYAQAWRGLGLAYGNAGQSLKAIESFQQALRINADYPEAWHGLGITYALSGQRGKVTEVYKRLKTLDPALAERFFKEVIVP